MLADVTTLKDLLDKALLEFMDEIQQEKWIGKERELISRFVFTKLIELAGKHPLFVSPAQIGIEVRVKQVKGFEKEFVCKDLIIWKDKNQTVWSKDNVPLFILEWKHNNGKPSKYDVEWLKKYTAEHPDCIGITLNVQTTPEYALSTVTVESGAVVN